MATLPHPAVTELARVRPQRLAVETFEAFSIGLKGTARRCPEADADTLDETLSNLAMIYGRGDTVFVRVADRNVVVDRFYAIREGKPFWTHLPGDIQPRRVAKKRAEHLFDLKPDTINA